MMINIPAEIFAHILSYEDQCRAQISYASLIASAILRPSEAMSHGIYVHTFSHPDCIIRAINESMATSRYDLTYAIVTSAVRKLIPRPEDELGNLYGAYDGDVDYRGDIHALSMISSIITVLVNDKAALAVCFMSQVLYNHVPAVCIIKTVNDNIDVVARYRTDLILAEVFDACIARLMAVDANVDAAYSMVIENVAAWGITRFCPDFVDDYYNELDIDVVANIPDVPHVSEVMSFADCQRYDNISPRGYLYRSIGDSGYVPIREIVTAVILQRIIAGDDLQRISEEWDKHAREDDKLCIKYATLVDNVEDLTVMWKVERLARMREYGEPRRVAPIVSRYVEAYAYAAEKK